MNLTNLFNHQKDKKGFVTVMNVLLKDISTKEPLLKLDSLKISNIAVEGNEKEIRGGLGAGLLMTYGYGRTATVEIEDAFASMDSLQYLFGTTTLLEGTDVEYNVNQKLTVAAGAVTLNPAAKSGTTVYGLGPAGENLTISVAGNISGIADQVILPVTGNVVFKLNGLSAGVATVVGSVTSSPIEDTDYHYETEASGDYIVIDTMASETVTITYSGASLDGSEVEVFYIAEGELGAKSITLKSTDFPAAVIMVGHTFLIDEYDGSKVLCEIEFPKFKLDPSFALSLEGEGDASTFSFTGKALENSDNEIFKLKMIGTYLDTYSI